MFYSFIQGSARDSFLGNSFLARAKKDFEKRFFFEILFWEKRIFILFSKSVFAKKEKESFFKFFFRKKEKRFFFQNLFSPKKKKILSSFSFFGLTRKDFKNIFSKNIIEKLRKDWIFSNLFQKSKTFWAKTEIISKKNSGAIVKIRFLEHQLFERTNSAKYMYLLL